MTTDFLKSLWADRIGGEQFGTDTQVYKFERIKRAQEAAKLKHPDIELLDMGVGEPDAMADLKVIQTLYDEALKWDNRGYADNGCLAFQEAAAKHMETYFGVQLDPKTELVHSMGSKSALSMLPACFINKDDIIISTSPGYPIAGTHTEYYGGNIYSVLLRETYKNIEYLSNIDGSILDKAKILLLNYPNNPTGATVDKAFFEAAVALAKKHNFIIIHDAAYAHLVYNQAPLSILSIPGAKDVAVELHSLSKSHNMTGWRIGWVSGNPEIIKAYKTIKDNTDSGQFLPIQYAAIKALESPEIVESTRLKYERRLKKLVEILNKHGFEAKMPGGTFFLYTRAPAAIANNDNHKLSFKTAADFSEWLIENQLISTVPWDEAGAAIRFSVTFTADNESSFFEMLDARLAKQRFIFDNETSKTSGHFLFAGQGS